MCGHKRAVTSVWGKAAQRRRRLRNGNSCHTMADNTASGLISTGNTKARLTVWLSTLLSWETKA